jgi:aryl-alcohol dehydrogenase-like predicted oxidoreductase
MRYKLFGGSGLRVSELFLGAMTFGEQGGVGAAPQECARILDAYADAGGNVIDTAINYRGGASEEIVGELLAGRRDRFVLSTKYTVSRHRDDPDAAGRTAFTGIQAPYNLLRRDIERELLPMAETLGLTVAAWSPLADGILSGKYAGQDASGQPSRVDPATVTEQQRTVAALVNEVAGGLGASPAQVAIAWTRARSPLICPIIGARRLSQLADNLGAADLDLPADMLARLDAATQIDLGFPATFIRDNTPWVFGAAALEGT